jgi:ABC-type transport system involved in cytochrome c biogenesis ATPase subunit
MKNDIIFSLTNLSISYDSVIFDNVSLAIRASEVTLIHGGNGAGKTTLCRILAGLEKKYEGRISLYGKNLSLLQVPELSNYLLYLKQEPETNVVAATADEDLSIWQHRFISNETDELQRQKALARFQIEDLKDKPCWELSTGQMKRIGLAALAMFEQKFWVLDEPSAALDDDNISILIKIIQKRKESGFGTLIMTHRNERFLPVADRICKIENKKIS